MRNVSRGPREQIAPRHLIVPSNCSRAASPVPSTIGIRSCVRKLGVRGRGKTRAALASSITLTSAVASGFAPRDLRHGIRRDPNAALVWQVKPIRRPRPRPLLLIGAALPPPFGSGGRRGPLGGGAAATALAVTSIGTELRVGTHPHTHSALVRNTHPRATPIFINTTVTSRRVLVASTTRTHAATTHSDRRGSTMLAWAALRGPSPRAASILPLCFLPANPLRPLTSLGVSTPM